MDIMAMAKISKLSKLVAGTTSIATVSEVNTPMALSITAGGFYSYSTGLWSSGTGWSYSKTDVGTDTRFIVEHPLEGQIRILYYTQDTTYLGYDFINTNESFTVVEGCYKFYLNYKATTSNPTSSLSAFDDTTTMALSSVVEAEVLTPVVDYVQDLSAQIETKATVPTKVMKVLVIGNSFSDDGFEHLHDIAKSAGIDTVVGVMYMGAGTLEQHWNNIQTSGTYEYRKWTKENGKVNTLGVTIPTAVTDEDWDYIVYQQASAESGVYSTFQPYLNDIKAYVDGIATNPKMKSGLQMTWAYASTSTHLDFDTSYGSNQLTMFNAITGAFRQAILETNIDVLFPTGTAIQNARTIPQMMAVEQELTRDGHHLGLSLGRLICAYTVFEKLLADYYGKDLYNDVTYRYISSASMVYFAKISAKNAVLNPFNVTIV